MSEFSELFRSKVQMHPTAAEEQRVKPPGKDVVFLLDGSDGTRRGFQAMRDFVQKAVEKLSVDDNKDRVSVVQYSRDPAVQFYLNTYTTKGDILDTVRGLRHKGGSPLKTGEALQYLRDNVFTASAGSRRLEGVPQVLILLSGGRSYDSVDAPATALKQMGVLMFAVGTRGSDLGELQKISHDSRNSNSVLFAKVLNCLSCCLFSVDTGKKDVVFLLDGSDGTRNGFPAMRDFVERVVGKLNVGPNDDRVSVVQYSRDPEVNFYLNTYTTKEDIVDSVRGLNHRGGIPLNTGAALRYVRDNVFTNSSGSRRLQGVPQMLILLNGGKSSDNVDTPASALRQQGIFVIGIGTRNSDRSELQKISHEPRYALSVPEFTDLPGPPGKDVVFLLDGSDGTRRGFQAMRDFVQKAVEKLSVDDNKDRVSVVQYSRDPAVQFYLNTYTTKGDILDTVRGLRHKGGSPLKTGEALQYLRDNVFTASAGSRRLEGVPQVLILLSGGRSYDSVDAPATALKQMGVLMFAVGTRGSDLGELQKISHDSRNAITVPEFTDLAGVQEQLQSSSNSVLFAKVLNCLSCCLFSVDTGKKDVVFLLDGSDGTRNGFPAMRDFVERVVGKLNVGPNDDRVSVVQYSRDPEVNFYLNTYTTKEDIVDSVRGLNHRGGIPLNTGAALRYVRDNVFTNSSGSRRLQGVPQMLILLNGGKSSDNVDTPASALRQQGIFVIGIGTRNSDRSELQKISHEPRYALSVPEFTDLPGVQEQLSTAVVVDDVVFLLDGSDGTRNGFPAMRDFVERVVGKLNVGPNDDRVSVVQYSRDPEVNFYLNTYTTKEDIVDSVRGLNHRGGIPLNTGAALRYVRDNVFTNSSGSRRLQGVPQMLILLNGGKSSDNVDTPASALRQQGIFVIGIGTRNSDRSELQKISHEPRYALSVPEFTDLPGVQEQLSTVLSTVKAVPPSRKPPGKDVVFLLDGSDGTRRGFQAMRDFVQKAVEKLSVDDNKDRVSVVQYSRDPAVQFYLNTYTTKGDILDTVRGLRHKGGSPLKTGEALQYLRDNVFTASAGSRRLEGVPQVLILLSGGRSYDSVDAPATALKQMGVLMFAVGTRGSDLGELQKISHDSRNAITVPEFTDLAGVQEQLQSSVEAVVVDVTPETPTETGMLTSGAFPSIPGQPSDTLGTTSLQNSSGSRRLQGVPQMLILLNGGKSSDNVDTPASALRQQGIFVIGIGTRNSDRSELQKISHDA
uniref:VWFA domain-containing protein n=1 Tax=Sparus aurata TaxID=8175 RepID=A0A671VC92_SPAAU